MTETVDVPTVQPVATVAPVSAAPGTPAPTENSKEKKKRRGRVADPRAVYPIPESGLTEVPSDYDPEKHRPLKSADFQDEAVFLRYQANSFEERAAKLRARAESLEKIGNVASRRVAAKVVKMREDMAKMLADLKAQGVDVSALVAMQE